jgi:hypothetical protein
MGLQDLITADLGLFFNTDEFGSSVSYREPNGIETDTTAVLFDRRTELRDVKGVSILYQVMACLLNKADVPLIDIRGVMVINETEWAISGSTPVLYEDDEVMTVQLERHQLREQTRPEYRAK